jgi:SPOR domain
MSSNAKRMPEVNLEDFERRLRAAGSAPGAVEDPLEELTRLVNTISTERSQPDGRAADASPVRAPTPMRPANLDDEPEYSPPAPEPAPDVFDDESAVEEAAEPPLLRRSIDEADFVDVPLPPARGEPQYAESGTAARKPSWYIKIGGFTAVALVLAAGAGYLKLHGARVAGGAPPMIMAAEGPSKVAPPDEKDVQSPSDSGALLNKDSTAQGGVKIVSHQEQPIDLALKGDSPVAPTKDTPIVPPGAGVAMIQPATPGAAAPAPEPAPSPPAAAPIVQKKGPKIVSVRPDGTLITPDATPAAPPPAVVPPPSPAPLPRKADAGPAVTTQPASPTLDLPPPKPTKTTARVNVAKTDTTGPTEPVNAPLQLGSAAPSAAADKAQKLPTKLRPPETADAQPAAAAAPSGGDWAVQLAAPRSEADAQSAIQKLQTKFASSLGDNDLVVRKAEVNGEAIYRVRAVGLTRADAVSLCQRLKSDGGDCFPTRN